MSTQIIKTKINDYLRARFKFLLILTWWEVEGDNTAGHGVWFKLGRLRSELDTRTGWFAGQPTSRDISPVPPHWIFMVPSPISQVLSQLRSELDIRTGWLAEQTTDSRYLTSLSPPDLYGSKSNLSGSQPAEI